MPYAPDVGFVALQLHPDSACQSPTRQVNSAASQPSAVTIERAISCASRGALPTGPNAWTPSRSVRPSRAAASRSPARSAAPRSSTASRALSTSCCLPRRAASAPGLAAFCSAAARFAPACSTARARSSRAARSCCSRAAALEAAVVAESRSACTRWPLASSTNARSDITDGGESTRVVRSCEVAALHVHLGGTPGEDAVGGVPLTVEPSPPPRRPAPPPTRRRRAAAGQLRRRPPLRPRRAGAPRAGRRRPRGGR